jgi:FlaA1/EpsC-like NDP-sugar epimerase
MEHNVAEAVLNNVLGTRNVVRLAAEHGTQHFVLISTDKAVRPTSIMGATKRLAEGIVHETAEQTRKPYISVRFGNVLGSRGSVVPTFMRQIAAGGPVTVTHPEMRRYFMTIPEAVQLVLQAGAMGRGQETFVLDMGEPVKIADLASDLIRLSGLEVNTDIEIRFTGSRPGEKLYEELFFSAENAVATSHPKILRGLNTSFYRDCPVSVAELIEAAAAHTSDDRLREMISLLVPEYEPPTTGEAPRRRALSPEVSGFGRAAAIGRGVAGSEYAARAGRRSDAAPRRSQS